VSRLELFVVRFPGVSSRYEFAIGSPWLVNWDALARIQGDSQGVCQ
jgi:hypothetical protein